MYRNIEINESENNKMCKATRSNDIVISLKLNRETRNNKLNLNQFLFLSEIPLFLAISLKVFFLGSINNAAMLVKSSCSRY